MPYKDPEVGRQKKREYCRTHSAEAVARVAAWRKKNPEVRSQHGKTYYQKHKERLLAEGQERYYRELDYNRFRKIAAKYGLTREEYMELYNKQNGSCALHDFKPAPGQLVVDHDHKTGRVRGLLCRPCNLAISKAEAEPDWFTKAQIYLLGEPSR